MRVFFQFLHNGFLYRRELEGDPVLGIHENIAVVIMADRGYHLAFVYEISYNNDSDVKAYHLKAKTSDPDAFIKLLESRGYTKVPFEERHKW